ncbi:hypothetical protein Goshw_004854 [Gossypium schwendimanii]|uniref:RNase H type-1 domain-containing protein n=1 Tax=Gossypium schwendimanii TaxID=34291 RepID=A0A7J9LEW0_GOSSC|nr:hypothetical protein [Gossypium schwendimanii]
MVQTVALAEIIVVLHRLQFAMDMGFSNVILESDSRIVIKNLKVKGEDNSKLRPITWDVHNMLKGFTSYRFEFVARKGNVATHAMASQGMKHLVDFFWVEEAQLKVLELAVLDRRFH